jgi:hypothetical protein
MYYLGSYLSFLPWKIPELLVVEAIKVYIKVGGWSSYISYHILPLSHNELDTHHSSRGRGGGYVLR